MTNNYPPNFIDSFIKSNLNKLYTPKVIVQNGVLRNVLVAILRKYFVSNSKKALKII